MLSKRTLVFALSLLLAAGFATSCSEDPAPPDNQGTDEPGEKPGDKPDEKDVLKNAEFSAVVSGDLVTTEAGGTATFEVKLDEDPGRPVSIKIVSNNDAEGIVSPGELIFDENNWSTPQKVTVTGVSDSVIDGDQAFNVILAYFNETKGETSVVPDVQKEVTVTNQDVNKAALLIDPEEGITVSEAGGKATFSVTLAAMPTAKIVIRASSENEEEVKVSSEDLTFTPDNWTTPKDVVIEGVDDYKLDGEQVTSVKLEVVEGDDAYKGMEPLLVTVTNSDNDAAGLTLLTPGDLKVAEDGTTATISVALVAIPKADVKFSVSSDNTAEGTVDVEEIVFTPETWNVPQNIVVKGVSDNLSDGDKEFNVIIGEKVTSDDADYAGLKPLSVKVVNTDTTTAGIKVSPLEIITSESNDDPDSMDKTWGSTEVFSVVLTAVPTADVTFVITNENPKEGHVDVEQLVFTSANWDVPQEVKVRGRNDEVKDGDQTYNVVLSNAVSSDKNYNGKFETKVKVTNADDDTPGITLVAPELLESTENGDYGTFSLMLSTRPAGNVMVQFSAQYEDGTPCEDVKFYTKKGEQLTLMANREVEFNALTWNKQQTIAVKSVTDYVMDGDINYNIVFDAVIASDPDYTGVVVPSIPAISKNADVAGVLINTGGADIQMSEEGVNASFQVSLTSKPTSRVTLNLTSDETEGVIFNKTPEFTPENWNTPVTVYMDAVDDEFADGDIEFFVEGVFESDDENFNGKTIEPIKVINKDNEVPGIVFAPQAMMFTKAEAKTFAVSLPNAPTASMTFKLSVSEDDQEFVYLGTEELTFTPENWNKPQEVTIKALKVSGEQKAVKIITKPVDSECKGYGGVDLDDFSVYLMEFTDLDFKYTGEAQSVKLYPATYKLEVWGASGGGRPGLSIYDIGIAGNGGYSVGTITLTDVTTVYAYVGGVGAVSDSSLAKGGWNGGGSTYPSGYGEPSGGGGGGTDFRIGGDTLYHRVIVAGGGGGGGEDSGDPYGHGGGLTGTGGSYNGTQTGGSGGGVFGIGGSAPNDGGGGGGGWYGGGTYNGSQTIPTYGSGSDSQGGGGGSGYVYTAATAANYPAGCMLNSSHYLSGASTIAGNASMPAPAGGSETGHVGNGYARISLIIE